MSYIPLREVAEKYGISYKTARTRCDRKGVDVVMIQLDSQKGNRGVAHIKESDVDTISEKITSSKYDDWYVGMDLAEELGVTSNKIGYAAAKLGYEIIRRKLIKHGNKPVRIYPPESREKIKQMIKTVKVADYEHVSSSKTAASTENREKGYYMRISDICWMECQQGA